MRLNGVRYFSPALMCPCIFSYGKFSRSFRLAENANAAAIAAACEHGQLTVTVPKVETPKTKTVDVNVA